MLKKYWKYCACAISLCIMITLVLNVSFEQISILKIKGSGIRFNIKYLQHYFESSKAGVSNPSDSAPSQSNDPELKMIIGALGANKYQKETHTSPAEVNLSRPSWLNNVSILALCSSPNVVNINNLLVSCGLNITDLRFYFI